MANTKLSPYQNYIHISRYARWRDDLKRRETWEETIDRYITFFKKKYPLFPDQEIRTAIENLEVMPSMRCLMSAGAALERDQIAGFNCAYIAIDNPRAFDEILYVLMCFAPETLVKTSSGDKQICDITINDEVLSFNKTSKQYEFIKPSQVVKTPSLEREKIELEFEDRTYRSMYF
jgi:hypothetical protein